MVQRECQRRSTKRPPRWGLCSVSDSEWNLQRLRLCSGEAGQSNAGDSAVAWDLIWADKPPHSPVQASSKLVASVLLTYSLRISLVFSWYSLGVFQGGLPTLAGGGWERRFCFASDGSAVTQTESHFYFD